MKSILRNYNQFAFWGIMSVCGVIVIALLMIINVKTDTTATGIKEVSIDTKQIVVDMSKKFDQAQRRNEADHAKQSKALGELQECLANLFINSQTATSDQVRKCVEPVTGVATDTLPVPLQELPLIPTDQETVSSSSNNTSQEDVAPSNNPQPEPQPQQVTLFPQPPLIQGTLNTVQGVLNQII